MRLAAAALTVSAAIALGGCNRFVDWADFEAMESVNVAAPIGPWPEGFELTAAQQEVYDERGRPDFFRARWDRRGRLTWGDDVLQRTSRQRIRDVMARAHHRDEPLPFDVSWIYQAEDQGRNRTGDMDIFRGDEVIFTGDASHDVEPVTDMLGVVIDHGDPEDRRAGTPAGGHDIESWVYFREGKIFHFIDGHLARIERQPPMPMRVRPEI